MPLICKCVPMHAYTDRSSNKNFLIQVTALEELGDKLRMRAKKNESLKETHDDTQTRLHALKGDGGIKERMMEFCEMVEDFLEQADGKNKEEVGHAALHGAFYVNSLKPFLLSPITYRYIIYTYIFMTKHIAGPACSLDEASHVHIF